MSGVKMLRAWMMLALSLPCGVAVAQQEMGEDGFPAAWGEDWEPSVFDVEQAMDAAVNGTAAGVAQGSKPMTWNVAEMPSVPSTSVVAAENEATAGVDGTAGGLVAAEVVSDGVVALPLRQVDLRVKPKVEGEDLGRDVPAGGRALGQYGLAPEGVALRVGWDNSRFANVNKVWPEHAGLLPPLHRALLGDVLVTPGAGPQGVSPTTWLAWRMKNLLELGQAEAAWQLGQVVSSPARSRDRELAEAWGLVRLVAGDTTSGCASLREEALAGTAANDTLWRQAVMVCQALTRGREGLGLSLQLAEGDGVMQSLGPLLKSLLDAVAVNGPAPVVPQGARVGPLEAALYGAYPALIREEVWPQLPDLTLWRLVRTDALPLTLRTRAAEGLVLRQGTAEAENALTQLYASFSFTPEQLSAPTATDLKDAVMRRALLWQAAAIGGGKAEAAWLALDTAWRDAGLEVLARQVMAPKGVVVATPEGLLRELEAALWRGERGRAEALWAKLSRAEGLEIAALRKRAVLGVLTLAVAGKDTGVWLDQWLAVVPLDSVAEKQRVLRQLAVWQAVGVTLEAAQQQEILVRLGDVPGAAQWPVWQELMLGVVREGRRGEALAMATQAASKEPGAVLAAGWVGGTLNILRELGDAQGLRRLALVSVLAQAREEAPLVAPVGLLAAPAVRGEGVSASVVASASVPALHGEGVRVGAGTLFLPMPSDDVDDRAPDWLLPPPRMTGPTPPVPPKAPQL